MASIRFRLDLSIECAGNNHASRRGRVMTWEDDALSAYEQNRAKVLESNKLASQRTLLLDKQSPHQWDALLEAFKKHCDNLNIKAGRPIVRSVATQTNHLKILREDRTKVEGVYVPETRKVKFSSTAVFFGEPEYELVARSIDGNELVAWSDLKTRELEQSEDVARSVLHKFLSAENSLSE